MTHDPFWLAVHFNEPTRILYAEPDQPAWREAGWTVTGPHVPAERLQEAVKALQAIYNRHHMAGDGSAGAVSGDALRALGIDPDDPARPSPRTDQPKEDPS